MLAVPLVDLRAQWRSIEGEARAAMDRVLERCDFILGSDVQQLEEEFAGFVGCRYGIGVSSGLDALRLALAGMNIGPGDEVIVPVNTFIATALAVSATGARPVLVDCDGESFNLDPCLIERAITPATRAILPVHLAGQAADMEPIRQVAARHGLAVIEDAAQAHGTRYRGQPCGALGDAACFSFYPGKNLGAYGDGGMVTTSDAALADRLRRLRNYGQRVKYEHVEQGLNARLDTLQAAVLRVKLRHLPDWNAVRDRHAESYDRQLAGVEGVRTPARMAYSSHIYHLYMLRCARRDELRDYLRARGIEVGIHYPIPIHLQQAYGDLGYHHGDFPVAEQLADELLSLPMFPELSREQIQYTSGIVREFYQA